MRLIDADELKKVIETYRPRKAFNDFSAGKNNMVNYCLDEIENAPTVDKGYQEGHIDGVLQAEKLYARPIGEWIAREDMDYLDENKVFHKHFECNKCGLIHDFIDGHTSQYNYCPECGAKMRKGVKKNEPLWFFISRSCSICLHYL